MFRGRLEREGRDQGSQSRTPTRPVKHLSTATTTLADPCDTGKPLQATDLWEGAPPPREGLRALTASFNLAERSGSKASDGRNERQRQERSREP